jgi:CubicO group peptidase (beta-lactamase class C family)
VARSVGRLLASAVLAVLLLGCSDGSSAPDPRPDMASPDQSERSQDMLNLVANADEPGCSVAVGRAGEVLWHGAQGLADIESGTPIDAETVFDIGSVSKQFTATAILLLEDAGKLRLEDPLSAYLPDLPAWSDKTTLAHLMHHTSGIPLYEPLLQQKGYEFTDRTTQGQAVKVLDTVQHLDFPPGSQWMYSNSNYVLLAEVVRVASGEPLAQYLESTIFEPLSLDMVVNPDGAVPRKALSYLGVAPQFSVVDSHWEQVGNGAIQATPKELVRWADNYRTATVGGPGWQRDIVAGAVEIPSAPVGEEASYGAGILRYEDGSLGHQGGWEGFVTDLWISSDRTTSIAVACNKVFDLGDLRAMTSSLIMIWSPP